MRLTILLPIKILLEETVDKVTAEAENGSFVLLPNHIDFVTAIVPGILSFESQKGERFVAVDRGILVKCGGEGFVSLRQAILGENLDSLQQTVNEEYRRLDDKEKQARSAEAQLEAGFIRGFIKSGGSQW
ncbi:ATP synthase, Delta/Epsilon chain, beta-sandwich domain protein [Lyngbya aestuarii BL J]|uniref:ATP synthase, Delta/Epsilon chain, beta-sandwich domain protein n=1 Tax=Lyngbya aestuarii BL J TaxID=1348334 RepID=U7QP45_9CYAN|nr:F0F1 ATP synthase subunit epsilon [Lyngbya aestuarii]ERT09754.1 ATP synthase, Delta/Epsilon chain, beta-sandwich domain protein [Lyngbya aestuarii BL J]